MDMILSPSSLTCSICSASSSDGNTRVLLCSGCACLHLCEGCARTTTRHPQSECARLSTARQGAIDGGFYEFPFAWYPRESVTFGCISEMLEYVRVKPCSAVAELLKPRAPPSTFFPFPPVQSARCQPRERYERTKNHMRLFWGAEGDAFFLAGGATGETAPDGDREDGLRPQPAIMTGWGSYVDMRSGSGYFPLVLDSAMSVYAAVARYCRLASGPRLAPVNTGTINITLLGVEVGHEVRYWPTFLELFNVLPDTMTIRLVMVGPELPSGMGGLRHTIHLSNERELIVEMRQESCGDDMELLAGSQVLCALNAGLPAYHAWEEGLRAIKKSGFAGVFLVTDLVEEALFLSRQALVRVFGDTVGKVNINGFRRPDACVRPDGHAMPSCGSNAFVCFVDCFH